MSGFRSSVWDPVLIISQIIAIQCFFYVSFGLWCFLLNLAVGEASDLDQLYRYEAFQLKTRSGQLAVGAFLLNSLTGSLALWYVVKRTKQCMDFVTTAHFLHLIACWIVNDTFPTALSWWLANIVSMVLTTVIGEYLCMHTELKEIPLVTSRKADL